MEYDDDLDTIFNEETGIDYTDNVKRVKSYNQDSWADIEDDTECGIDDNFYESDNTQVTPEDERTSKQLVTQLKIESLDDEFNDKKRIDMIKKRLNAHKAVNPHADIIDICAKMISYRDKKIHKAEKDSENQ
jgi:hypothetical protein